MTTDLRLRRGRVGIAGALVPLPGLCLETARASVERGMVVLRGATIARVGVLVVKVVARIVPDPEFGWNVILFGWTSDPAGLVPADHYGPAGGYARTVDAEEMVSKVDALFSDWLQKKRPPLDEVTIDSWITHHRLSVLFPGLTSSASVARREANPTAFKWRPIPPEPHPGRR